MKRRRSWLITSFFLAFSLLLNACTNKATTLPPTAEPLQATEIMAEPAATRQVTQTVEPTGSPSPSPAGACPTGTITLTVHDWSNPARQAAWDQVIGEFNVAHPCLVVESIKLIEDRDVRFIEVETGKAPDLVGLDAADLPRLVQMGGLLDLSQFMQADSFDPAALFYEAPAQAGYVDGTPYALPKDYSVSAFYVNTGLFAKAGIPLPEAGWTYEDYLQIARQLTLDAGGNNALSPDFDPANIVQWGTSLPYWGGDSGWWRGFQGFLYAFGAHTISEDGQTTEGFLNSVEAVAAWEWYRDLIHKFHVAPGAAYLAAAGLDYETLFAQGKLAISGSYWGPWYQEAFNQVPNLQWSVVPLPAGTAGRSGASMWMGWGIHAGSKNPEAAWELLKWLATEPGQSRFALQGLTAHQQVAADLQQEGDPFWGVFLAEVPFQGRLDDLRSPFYTNCVDIPAARLLGGLFQDTGAAMDIQGELDRLAAEANRCLSAAAGED